MNHKYFSFIKKAKLLKKFTAILALFAVSSLPIEAGARAKKVVSQKKVAAQKNTRKTSSKPVRGKKTLARSTQQQASTARLVAEQKKKAVAARLAADVKKRASVARLAAAQKNTRKISSKPAVVKKTSVLLMQRQADAARLAAEQKKKADAARLAAEQKKKTDAARLAAEQKKKADAARLAAEQKKKTDAARLAAEQKKKADAARLAAEQKKKADAARLAAEQKKKADAARLVAEQKKQADAARLAVERQRQEAARLAAERQRQEAARLAAERQRQEAAKRATEHEFLNRPFVKQELGQGRFNRAGNQITFPGVDLGYQPGTRARTEQYDDAGLHLPAAPVLHPYHPAVHADLPNNSSPAFTLNVKLPGYEEGFVLEALRAHLAGIAPRDIETFMIFQDAPWQGVPLQFKPQYGFAPNTPSVFRNPSDTQHFRAQVGVFSKQHPNVCLQGQPDGRLIEIALSVHPDPRVGNRMVSSGNVLSIENINLNESQILYFVAKKLDQVTGALQKVFVVKDVLFNQADELVFEQLLTNSNNLTDLKGRVRTAKTAHGHFATLDLDDMFNLH